MRECGEDVCQISFYCVMCYGYQDKLVAHLCIVYVALFKTLMTFISKLFLGLDLRSDNNIGGGFGALHKSAWPQQHPTISGRVISHCSGKILVSLLQGMHKIPVMYQVRNIVLVKQRTRQLRFVVNR